MAEDIVLTTIRLSIPILFAAYGGMLCERSGVANIALEGLLLFSAFAAASATHLTQNVYLGVFSGLMASTIAGAIFGIACIWGRADQIVMGTAFNLLAIGTIPLITRSLFSVTGSTPSLPLDLRLTNPYLFLPLGVLTTLFLMFLFGQTRFGLRTLSAGENPLALSSQGVSYKQVRLKAVVLGSALVGIGGVYLSLCQASGYIRNMSAGRGYIALAALIFGGWRPLPTLFTCLFFGLADAAQISIQGLSFGSFQVPHQFVQISPYVITLLALMFFSGRMQAPGAINRDIDQLRSN